MIISTSLLLPEFLKHVFLGIHLYCHIDPSDKSSAPKSQRSAANPQHTLQLPEGRGRISQTTKFGYRKKKRKGKACLPWLSSIFQSAVVALTLQNVLKSVTLKRKFGEREGVSLGAGFRLAPRKQ